jgi:tetratricopeptide (TPR) repeat protein
VNVLLHAAGCVLLWRALARLKIPGAWLTAALFAVHPVGAMSVAWISEMKNTLSLCFCLLSFLFFLRSDDEDASGEKRRSKLFYCLSLVAFLLALLSKTSTVMLPVVLLGCAWWQRGSVARRDWRRTAPFFLLALILGCSTVWLQAQVLTAGDPVEAEKIFARLAGAGMAIWFYLGKAILPLNLTVIYPRWTIDPRAPLVYLPALMWLVLLAVCWRWRSKNWGRAALFGLGCFTVLLFPVLGFLTMDYLAISRVSDHFQYLALIAVAALVAGGLSQLLPARIFHGVAGAMILALSVLTFQRAHVFTDSETLWRDTLAKNSESWTAHNNLGCILADRNELDNAIAQFEASLRYNPANAAAHCNLGRALAFQHKFAAAEEQFQAGMKIKFADAGIQESYAAMLLQQGKAEQAVKHLREAVRVEPTDDLRLRFAGLLHQTGNSRESAEQYRLVLARQPDSLEALNNLAWILATSPDAAVRNGAEAVPFAEKVCRLTDRKNAVAIGTLAAAYAEAGRFADAVSTATQAATQAEAEGNMQFATMNRQLRALYQSGRPYHEPAPGGR